MTITEYQVEVYPDLPDVTGEPLDTAAAMVGEWAGYESPWRDDTADVIVGLVAEHVVIEANRRGATANETAMATVNAITAAGIVLLDASEVLP